MTGQPIRDYYFDNIKFILICLVVVGHFIEPIINTSAAYKALYLLIYSFHIPAFVFVAGYLSKKYGTIKDLKKPLIKLIWSYIVFQSLYCLCQSYWYNELLIQFLVPNWIMWFLLSLIFWRITIPFFKSHRILILISVVLAVMIGYFDSVGPLLSISRTFVFLPFFLAGYFIDRSYLKKLNLRISPILRVLITIISYVIVLYLFYSLSPLITEAWFYGSNSFVKLGYLEWYAGIYRFSVLLIGVINTGLFLWLIPKRQLVISRLGERSLYPYLIHGFFVKYAVHQGIYVSLDSSLGILFIIIATAVLITIVLSSKLMNKIFRPLVEPPTWIINL